MRIGVAGIQLQRLAITGLRFAEAPQVVVDVAEIEMRFEEVGLETDGALVQRLRFRELVAAVMNVRQVDERRRQRRIDFERPPINSGRFVDGRGVAVVKCGRRQKTLFGHRRVPLGNRRIHCRSTRLRWLSQRDDFRRRRVEPEIQLELTMPRCHERAHQAAKGGALRQRFVKLFHHRQIRKLEQHIRVRAEHRPEQTAFHQIAEMVLPYEPVS